MKRFILPAFFLISVAQAQVTKYVIASCIINSADGKKDTVFNGNDGNIFCTLDMHAKSIQFDWQTKKYTSLKSYKVVSQKIIKGRMYETMGVYSMKLDCRNKKKEPCTIEFGINSRINNIDIVLVDGPFVLNYRAVQTQ